MKKTLLKDIRKLVEAGDSDALQKLFVERFDDFEEEDQEGLLFGAFIDAMDTIADREELARFQNEGTEKLYQLQAVRDILEMRVKAHEQERDGEGDSTPK